MVKSEGLGEVTLHNTVSGQVTEVSRSNGTQMRRVRQGRRYKMRSQCRSEVLAKPQRSDDITSQKTGSVPLTEDTVQKLEKSSHVTEVRSGQGAEEGMSWLDHRA